MHYTTLKSQCDALRRNRNLFYSLENKLLKHPGIKNANRATNFAVKVPTSIYYSAIIEKFYIDLAIKNRHETNQRIKAAPNTFLHVMTRSHNHGGHTRLVERWIYAVPQDQHHSLALTNQKKPLPTKIQFLLNQTKLNSVYKLNPSDTLVKRANKLRAIAQPFENIILHHHMDDPIPLMAFSPTNSIWRIFVLNHAGHLFWLGRAIASHVIDLETGQNTITQKKRGIQSSSIFQIPAGEIQEITAAQKLLARKNLSLPQENKILVTMASQYKTITTEDLNFTEAVETILRKQADTIFIGIGIQPSTKIWAKIQRNFSGRVILTGVLNHQVISEYLRSADLYLDSYPMSSWISMLDAVAKAGLPVLSLKTSIGHPLFISDTEAVCTSPDQLIKKSILHLTDSRCRKSLQKILRKNIFKHNSNAVFQEQFAQLLKKNIPISGILSESFNTKARDYPLDLLRLSIFQASVKKKLFLGLPGFIGLGVNTDHQVITYSLVIFRKSIHLFSVPNSLCK